MNMVKSPLRRVWQSAQLYIGFHRDTEGRRRSAPHVWPPKNGRATIHEDTSEQEVFLVLQSAEGEPARDLQIKLRPEMVVLRRDEPAGWDGVIVEQHSVSIKVGGVSIRVNNDGSITRQDGDSTTWVEADGGVLKKTEFVDASMSPDGSELSRRTPDNLSAITGQGVLSRDR